MNRDFSNALLESNDNSSDYDDYNTNLLDKKIKDSKSDKSVEIGGLKQLPSFIFFSFLLIFGVLTLNFSLKVSHIKVAESDLYMQKFSFHYFSEYFSLLPCFFKLLLVSNQFTLFWVLIFLNNLIKQRIAVPELKHQKWRNSVAGGMGLISIISLITLTYYYDFFLQFSRERLFLVDNIVLLLFMFSSFCFCLFSFQILSQINGNGLQKDKGYLTLKRYVLALMLIQITLYSLCLCLVSFYEPKIPLEKILSSALVLTMSVNSIIFFFCYSLYIWTLRFDMYYVLLNLQIQPDIEYFVDFDPDEEKEKV